jgi:hypothetical protein
VLVLSGPEVRRLLRYDECACAMRAAAFLGRGARSVAGRPGPGYAPVMRANRTAGWWRRR